MNVQHSSRSDEWQTPPDIIQRSKTVLGWIDLDPASSPEANINIGASKILTRADNALLGPWPGRSIFLNPPGGKIGNQSKTALFWQKLMEHRAQGALDHAIFLAFSLEALQVTQGKGCLAIGQFPLCIPSSRIAFLSPSGEVGDAPSHSNCIVYVPGFLDRTELFYETFVTLGNVLNTRRLP